MNAHCGEVIAPIGAVADCAFVTLCFGLNLLDLSLFGQQSLDRVGYHSLDKCLTLGGFDLCLLLPLCFGFAAELVEGPDGVVGSCCG